MLEYYSGMDTFACLSDKYIFYGTYIFYRVVPLDSFDSSSVESIKHQFNLIFKPRTMERFEKSFITDFNDDDNIYLYLKIKRENNGIQG